MTGRTFRKDQKGFTLVEMVVVLLIMSIMMGATVWGVTGWIQHFTYIRNEETARYIYLGAQSGLSDQAKRGTLDQLMDEIRKAAASGSKAVIVTSAEKSAYGLPTEKDLHDEEHEYAYLKVDKGGIEANPLLDKLVSPYLSEAETLDGSVVLEMDLTAGKVYSVFYSTWATDFAYGSSACTVRGSYGISKTGSWDSRLPASRNEYCVGYYGTDQVNVAQIEASEEEIDLEAMLFNEETLHLDFHAKTPNRENYTKYQIDFYKKGETEDEKVFGVELEPGDNNIFGQMAVNTGLSQIDPKPCKLKTVVYSKDADGKEVKTESEQTFFVGFKKSANPNCDPNTDWDVTLLLDQQMDSLSLALMDVDKTKGIGDKDGLSITRFMGDNPAIIYAVVNVSPSSRAGSALSGSGTKTSNRHNDLYETDYEDELKTEGEEQIVATKYSIYNNRHFYNIRFAEQEKERENQDKYYTYTLTNDIEFAKSEIYYVHGTSPGYGKCADAQKVFATLPVISDKSLLDGNKKTIFDLKMDNSSHVEYPRNDDGSVKTGTADNQAVSVGMIAQNDGRIRSLVLRGAKATFMTKAEAQAKATKDGFPICDDHLQAVGIVSGRSTGSIREVYLDDACELSATIFQATTPKKDPGCGIGMIAGTVKLSEKTLPKDAAASAQTTEPLIYDRIRTGGKITASLSAAFAKITDDVGTDERNTALTTDTNADKYAYGIGGVFGYVYGDFSKITDLAKQPSVGWDAEKVKAKATSQTASEQYQPIELKSVSGTTIVVDKANVFEGFVDQTNKIYKSIENRAIINTTNDSKNIVFAGGILGNIEMNLATGSYELKDPEEASGKYAAIPDKKLAPQIINCRNYGGVYGEDFIGGIVGVNQKLGYIKDCYSYGNLKASKGVSAGIAAENFGYIQQCHVDREKKDDVQTDGYYPQISGNVEVAGCIASINHKDAVLKDCECALSDGADVNLTDDKAIKISGNEMRTIGYIAGMNYGVVNGGIVGEHLGYETKKDGIIIGGIVGINYKDGLVKNIESDMKLELVNAQMLGGVTGLNHGLVKKCIFAGYLTQATGGVNTRKLRVGGISAVNQKQDENAASPVLEENYLVGAKIQMRGMAVFTEDSTSAAKISGCSAIGGVCGENYKDSVIRNCYVTAHYEFDSNGAVVMDQSVARPKIVGKNEDELSENNGMSVLSVANGMVGGIAGVNEGDLFHCGYTDRELILRKDLENMPSLPASNGGVGAIVDAGGVSLTGNVTDMKFADSAMQYLELATGRSAYGYYASDAEVSKWTAAKNPLESGLVYAHEEDASGPHAAREKSAAAAEKLRALFMKDLTADLNSNAAKNCGYLNDKAIQGINALPKKTGANQPEAYQNTTNTYLVNLDKGVGYLGGIAGYNAASGSLLYCSSGRWVVESYYPKETYNAVGGIVGENAAINPDPKDIKSRTPGDFRYNVNLAYVRREEPYVNTNSPREELNKHAFTYVGGVIGSQKNESISGWVMEGCANAGKVVAMYGNNVGGVIAKLMKNGGTMQYCYNYGALMTGFSDNGNKYGGYIGTAGGVVAHMTDLTTDQAISILSCANHGIVNLPINGYDRINGIVLTNEAKYAANDVGGVAGQLSSPKNDRYYALNIRDCINGWGAEVYTHSTSGGILGRVGGVSSYDESSAKKTYDIVNNVVINIADCRGYSDDLWQIPEGAKVGDTNKIQNGTSGGTGNIFGVRPTRTGSGDKGTGYTSIQNCLGFRVSDFDNNSNYNDNKGKIVGNRMNSSDTSWEWFELCANNYYVDNYSFQYLKPSEDIYQPTRRKQLGTVTNEMNWLSSVVNGEKAPGKTNNGNHGNGNNGNGNGNNGNGPGNNGKGHAYGHYKKVNDLEPTAYAGASAEVEYAQGDALAIKPYRLYAVSINDDSKHALVSEQYGYAVKSCNVKNSCIEPYEAEGETETEIDALKARVQNTNGLTTVGPVVTYYDEKGLGLPIGNLTKNTVNHYPFRKLYDLGAYESGEATLSRIPESDEFDFDAQAAYVLDRDYIKFVDWIKENQEWDKVINLNVTEDVEEGRYFTKWDIEPLAPSRVATATEFEMTISVYSLKKGEVFNVADVLGEPAEDKPQFVNSFKQTAYTRTTTFTVPNEWLSDSNLDYYAVVVVKDVRDINGQNKSVVTDPIKSWIQLKPKLPQPEFEIVAYGEKWMLHLTNESAETYKNYTNEALFQNLKIGAYLKDGSGNKIANSDFYLTKNDLHFEGEENLPLLYNAVEINKNLAKGVKNEEVWFYAEADGAMASDPYSSMVYIPQKAHAENIIWTVTPDPNTNNVSLETNRPEYSGVLTYQQYDTTVVPPVEQVFKAELYGIKKDATGKDEYHETLVTKEYRLNVGESTDVHIGYYDADSLSVFTYDSYGIDIWYASSGQGPVNQYFEVTKERAGNGKTVRSTGFITDKSTSDTKYYYHAIKLMPASIEFVRVNRSKGWYGRVLNTSDYENLDAVTAIKVSGSTKSTSKQLINGVLANAAGDWGYGTNKTVSLKTTAPGCYDSAEFVYGYLNNNKLDLPGMQLVNMKPLSGDSLTLDETGKMSYHGTLHYEKLTTDPYEVYFRRVLSAKDAQNKDVVLYMDSNDIRFDAAHADDGSGDGAGLDISFDVSPDEGIGFYPAAYHDFKVAVWYSSVYIPTQDDRIWFRQFFDVEKSVAESQSYDIKKGILTCIGGGAIGGSPSEPVYYFASPFADPTYVTHNTHKLYRESTIAWVKVLSVQENGKNKIKWITADPSLDASNGYKVELSYYQIPKDSSVVYDVDSLRAAAVSAAGANGATDGQTPDVDASGAQGVDDGNTGNPNDGETTVSANSVSGNSVSGNDAGGNDGGNGQEGSTDGQDGGDPNEGGGQSAGTDASEAPVLIAQKSMVKSGNSCDLPMPKPEDFVDQTNTILDFDSYNYLVIVKVIDSEITDETEEALYQRQNAHYYAEALINLQEGLPAPDLTAYGRMFDGSNSRWCLLLTNRSDYAKFIDDGYTISIQLKFGKMTKTLTLNDFKSLTVNRYGSAVKAADLYSFATNDAATGDNTDTLLNVSATATKGEITETVSAEEKTLFVPRYNQGNVSYACMMSEQNSFDRATMTYTAHVVFDYVNDSSGAQDYKYAPADGVRGRALMIGKQNGKYVLLAVGDQDLRLGAGGKSETDFSCKFTLAEGIDPAAYTDVAIYIAVIETKWSNDNGRWYIDIPKETYESAGDIRGLVKDVTKGEENAVYTLYYGVNNYLDKNSKSGWNKTVDKADGFPVSLTP